MDTEIINTETNIQISRDKIRELDSVLKSLEGHQVSDKKCEVTLGCKYEHEFGDGIYVRKMFIPKGLVITTKVHLTRHPYFIMYGDVVVYKDNETVRIIGPYHGFTEKGTVRALYTNEDTLWWC